MADAHGLTTSTVPYGPRTFDIEFDFIDQRLRIRSSSGGQRDLALEASSVAAFYRRVMAACVREGLAAVK